MVRILTTAKASGGRQSQARGRHADESIVRHGCAANSTPMPEDIHRAVV